MYVYTVIYAAAEVMLQPWNTEVVPSPLLSNVNIFYHQEILEISQAFHDGTRIQQWNATLIWLVYSTEFGLLVIVVVVFSNE